VSSVVVDPPCTAAPVRAHGRTRLSALSRPGAIAAVIATGPTPRMLRGSVRIGLLVAGSLIIGSAVAVMLWTELGPGPLDVFIGAVRARTGLSLTVSVWLVIAAMIGAAWAMGRRPGPGTLLSPLIVGPIMEAGLTWLHRVDAPDQIVLVVAIHVAAVFVAGIGAGALIVSGLGAGSGELLAAAASERTGRPEPRLRMAFELGLLIAGVALGGPIGLGTVVVALTIGPAVMVGFRAVDGLAVSCRTRLGVARETGSAPRPPVPVPGRSRACRPRS
jgi:uncharacterized membrane protein YczE